MFRKPLHVFVRARRFAMLAAKGEFLADQLNELPRLRPQGGIYLQIVVQARLIAAPPTLALIDAQYLTHLRRADVPRIGQESSHVGRRPLLPQLGELLGQVRP